MVSNVWVIVKHVRDFRPLIDHMTNLRNFPMVKFVSFQQLHFHFN